MIDLTHISKQFSAGSRSVQALDDVSLHVEKGTIHGLIGSSGAGKSTLLRCINLLERPDGGDVMIDGESLLGLNGSQLSQRRRNIGMIFQQFNLLDSKTIRQNIALPMKLAGRPANEIDARVDELLGYVELSDKGDTYPPRLSGGQKQRVGIARALALKPEILLCDEATSALDPETTDSILELLQRVNRDLGITIVVVTHEMSVIAKICQRVSVLSQGRIVEEGPVLEVFSDPQQPITKRFVRTILDDRVPPALVDGIRATEGDWKIWRLTYRGDASAGSSLAEINKLFGVTTSLFYATVHEIDGVVLGVLVVQVRGEASEIERAQEYLEAHGVGVVEGSLEQ